MIRPSARSQANDTLVCFLKRQPVVVLSPHFDDACLSLGGVLCALHGATLVNIFTRSLWLPQSPNERATEEQVRAIRESEDRAFAAHCGLARHDLQVRDPGAQGRNSLDLLHLEQDVADATPALLRKLDELAGEERSFLFCPMGIGRHVNHRATAEIVLRHLEPIRQKYDLLFYEDLPYAANPYRRLGGLGRVRRRLRGSALRRQVFLLDWPEKEALIGLYPSQFPPPPSRRQFRPAALWPLGFHEAFWSIHPL